MTRRRKTANGRPSRETPAVSISRQDTPADYHHNEPFPELLETTRRNLRNLTAYTSEAKYASFANRNDEWIYSQFTPDELRFAWFDINRLRKLIRSEFNRRGITERGRALSSHCKAILAQVRREEFVFDEEGNKGRTGTK